MPSHHDPPSAQISAIRNRLLLVAAAILFSTGGVAIKVAALTPWQIASFRSAVAAVALLAALPEARKGWSWRIVPVSAAYAATLILFVLATRLTTAANAIFLQCTAPLYLLLLGPLLLREPVRRSDLLYMVAVAAGMALFFAGAESPVTSAPDPFRGKVAALASGLTYALTLAGLRWVERKNRVERKKNSSAGVAAITLGNLMAFLAALPLALPAASFSPAAIGVILYLGIFQIGLAYVCVTRAIRHVTAFEANAVLLLEPALNPVWVWLLHGERPGARALAGGAIILCATLTNTLHQSRSFPRTTNGPS